MRPQTGVWERENGGNEKKEISKEVSGTIRKNLYNKIESIKMRRNCWRM